jgi:hypothetical protein
MTKFNTRLHLIALASDAPQIEAALDKISHNLARFVPGEELKPDFVVASGQWTAEEAAAVVAVLASWPATIVERGYADGAEDVAAVEVEPGQDASKIPPDEVRKSFERVVEERAATIVDPAAVEAAVEVALPTQ